MTLGSHQRTIGKNQVRITPRWILEPLGPFDTDPCAADPRPWNCANVSITERQDSLAMDWRGFGRVWLNPPFDRRVVGRFIVHLAAHNRGVALVHARTETEWFRPIWEGAAALLFLAGRVIFHNTDGSPCGVEDPRSRHYGKPANSGAPVALAAFGFGEADCLAACGLAGAFVPLRLPRFVLVAALAPGLGLGAGAGAAEGGPTWREAVVDWLRERDGPVGLDEIYRAFAAHPKAGGNPNWRAKIRQTLQRAATPVSRGVWKAAAAAAPS